MMSGGKVALKWGLSSERDYESTEGDEKTTWNSQGKKVKRRTLDSRRKSYFTSNKK